MSPELTAKKNAALDHVKTVRGQLDEVARMLESDAYCVEVMKQIQTVQHSLDWNSGFHLLGLPRLQRNSRSSHL